jgi:Predicted nucleic acid-binding protein, contains PIN domain
MRIVPDASVAIKWYINEVHTSSAEKLLDGTHELHAPELILPEFGNIVWKKVRRRELSSVEGSRIISTFAAQNIEMHSHKYILNAAFTGAEATGQTAYDWSYLALAVSLSCPFVTADERFFKALANSRLSKNLMWIGDV